MLILYFMGNKVNKEHSQSTNPYSKNLKLVIQCALQDESSPPGSGGKSDSNRSSGGSGGSGEGLMQEMNALLARR